MNNHLVTLRFIGFIAWVSYVKTRLARIEVVFAYGLEDRAGQLEDVFQAEQENSKLGISLRNLFHFDFNATKSTSPFSQYKSALANCKV